MEFKTLTSFEDVLTSELESIYGGNEQPVIECKGDGVVHLPPNQLSVSVF
ncbi:hypothetical protein [Segatella paludivivens]|nr:hypothetical protein [Segatella paludivivens]